MERRRVVVRLQLGHDLGEAAGDLEAVDHRLQVQAGPTHQHGPAAPVSDVGEGVGDCGLEGVRPRRPPTGRPGRSRWCGTSACSAAVGLAVPMSMPRYTCIESTDTSSTSPRWRARARASDDLPDAVVPTMASGGGAPSGSSRWRPAARGWSLTPATTRGRAEHAAPLVGGRHGGVQLEAEQDLVVDADRRGGGGRQPLPALVARSGVDHDGPPGGHELVVDLLGRERVQQRTGRRGGGPGTWARSAG